MALAGGLFPAGCRCPGGPHRPVGDPRPVPGHPPPAPGALHPPSGAPALCRHRIEPWPGAVPPPTGAAAPGKLAGPGAHPHVPGLGGATCHPGRHWPAGGRDGGRWDSPPPEGDSGHGLHPSPPADEAIGGPGWPAVPGESGWPQALLSGGPGLSAWTVGNRQPAVWVSDRLVELLDREELEGVLATSGSHPPQGTAGSAGSPSDRARSPSASGGRVHLPPHHRTWSGCARRGCPLQRPGPGLASALIKALPVLARKPARAGAAPPLRTGDGPGQSRAAAPCVGDRARRLMSQDTAPG